ncbi:hypothetical protein [Polyangium sorediatum]|uniref:Lipoprotein n=1 Tax=Polyangium sorediatum TaxID=889274 RepID=A0ABT6NT67_9BACT|nr:hypothetical protein [Polyangium sorediatum]MDI1431535.1 hypothetical protein [Polyangium sorediatum]
MPHADRRIRRSLGLLAVLGLSAAPLACGLDKYGSEPVNPGGAAGSGGIAGAGGMGGAGASGGMGGTGGELCTAGETRPCYSGPAGTEGVGNCQAGTQFCADDGSEFGPCEAQVVPAAAEDCNVAGDEDCNDEADEMDKVCVCAPGADVECDLPDLEGTCAVGKGTCSSDGKTIEGCMQVTFPAFDNCTTATDEDCDGTAIAMCTGTVKQGFTPPGKNSDPLDDGVYDVALTPDGGYVVAGVVDAALGPDLFVFSGSQGSAYVAKVGADGNMQWAKTFSANVALARGVTVSSAGQITVVGEYNGSINFGGNALQSQELDIFIATFDAAGTHVWSKKFGTTNAQSAQDVDVDAAGNLFVTGWVTDESVSLGGNNLDPDGEDIFLASYDSAGNHRWSKIFASNSNERGRRLTVTKDGNVAILGETYDTGVDLGNGHLQGAGDRDFVVAMYNGLNGNHIWSKLYGSAGDQFHGNIAAAPNSNVLLTGRFTGSLNFGGGPMTAVGAADLYVAELLAANGNHVNSKRYGITGTSRGAGIAADGAGNILVTGHFDGSLDFGAGPIATGSGFDVFVVKLAASNWAPLWTKKLGVTGTQTAYAAAVDAKGDVILGGSFESEIAFGDPLGTIPSSGGADLFGVRLAP